MSVRRPAAHAVRTLVWLAFAALSLTRPSRAPASTEEFSTFHTATQEEDDESTIDHRLTQIPPAWDPDWDYATNALRTSQGCLTSGQWFIDTRLKLETSLGDRARFGVDYTDHQSDDASYTNTNLVFRWPVARGRITAMFRPYHDKSRQDFGLAWGAGSDTTIARFEFMWVFEDMFNNLWAWRQTRVGQAAEPYTRHPYEPDISFALHTRRVHGVVEGAYLTPSVKHVTDPADPTAFQVATLWGTRASGTLDVVGPLATWHVDGYLKQARSEDDAAASNGQAGADFRRQWWVTGGLDRTLGRRAAVTWRWMYMERWEGETLPIGDGVFHSIDRVQHVELHGSFRPTVAWRLGWMHDHINVRQDPGIPTFTWGTRGENRIYLGLDLRFSKVRTGGVEGIELDREPYPVAHHHDKGFLTLQSLF